MAVLLMVLMIAPLGVCLQQIPKNAHSCCMQAASPHALRTDCCVIRTQLPATLAANAVPGSSPSETVHEYAVCVKTTATDEHRSLGVIPPLSPPTGAFILRI
jgi:hypothetical protein